MISFPVCCDSPPVSNQSGPINVGLDCLCSTSGPVSNPTGPISVGICCGDCDPTQTSSSTECFDILFLGCESAPLDSGDSAITLEENAPFSLNRAGCSCGIAETWETFENGVWTAAALPAVTTCDLDQTQWRYCCPEGCLDGTITVTVECCPDEPVASNFTVFFDPNDPETIGPNREGCQLIAAGDRFNVGDTTGALHGLQFNNNRIDSFVMQDGNSLRWGSIDSPLIPGKAICSGHQWVNDGSYSPANNLPDGTNPQVNTPPSDELYFDGTRAQMACIEHEISVGPDCTPVTVSTGFRIDNWMVYANDQKAVLHNPHAPNGANITSPFSTRIDNGNLIIETRDSLVVPPNNTNAPPTVRASIPLDPTDIQSWWGIVYDYCLDPTGTSGYFNVYLNKGNGWTQIVNVTGPVGYWFGAGSPLNDGFYPIVLNYYSWHQYVNSPTTDPTNFDPTYPTRQMCYSHAAVSIGAKGASSAPVSVEEHMDAHDYFMCAPEETCTVSSQPINQTVSEGQPVNFQGGSCSPCVGTWQKLINGVWVNQSDPNGQSATLALAGQWRMCCEPGVSYSAPATLTVTSGCTNDIAVFPQATPYTSTYTVGDPIDPQLSCACTGDFYPQLWTGTGWTPTGLNNFPTTAVCQWTYTFGGVTQTVNLNGSQWRICCPDGCSHDDTAPVAGDPGVITLVINGCNVAQNDEVTRTDGDGIHNSDGSPVTETFCLPNCAPGAAYMWQMRVQQAGPITAPDLPAGDPALTGAWFNVPEFAGLQCVPLEIKLEDLPNTNNDAAHQALYADLHETFYFEIRGSCENDGTYSAAQPVTIIYDHTDEGVL